MSISPDGIDMDSILKLAKEFINSKDGQDKIGASFSDFIESGRSSGFGFRKGTAHTPEEAGSKFGQVLRDTIQSSGLPSGVISVLEDYDYSVFKDSRSPFRYMVVVAFAEDTARETMSTKKKYYTVDLANLYNYGVDHTMDQIVETTPDGTVMRSRTIIPSEHFVEQAIIDFMGNYGVEYGVDNIEYYKDTSI